MDLQSKVLSAFRKRFSDSRDTVARADLTRILQALGLSPAESESLLQECDSELKSHLSYKDFLDFVYSPDSIKALEGSIGEQELLQASASTACPTSDTPVGADRAALDEEDVTQPAKFEEAEEEWRKQAETDAKKAESEKRTREKEAEEEQRRKKQAESDAVKAEAEKRRREEEEEEEEQADEKDDKESKDSKVDKDDSDDKDDVLTAGARTPPDARPGQPRSRVRQCSQCKIRTEVFEDPEDNEWYCERCWMSYYGAHPRSDGAAFINTGLPAKLVGVVAGKEWQDGELQTAWARNQLVGWPPFAAPNRAVSNDGDPLKVQEAWASVKVHLNPGLVGSHARECTRENRPHANELLCERYLVEDTNVVGVGHFTRAFRARDITTGEMVCVKRHNSLTVELLTDLLTIGKRLEAVDPEGVFFPRLMDSFFYMVGYTVEKLLVGCNCLEKRRADPYFFRDFANLQIVARGVIRGLELFSKAGVVHCDVKADNIMWLAASEENPQPSVRLVDFGCSRLDKRREHGRNWALAENGAGHLGKWTPEMMLRLPITDRADVWGLAVSLLELHSGRHLWCCESDTAAVVLAQVLGLVNAKNGLPESLMKKSPLDIRQLYTPAPAYFPVQRGGNDFHPRLKEFRPATWGLGCVLGDESTWDETRKQFASYVLDSMVLDHEQRPSAEKMVQHPFITQDVPIRGSQDMPARDSKPDKMHFKPESNGFGLEAVVV